MNHLKIAAQNYDIIWKNKKANFAMAEKFLDSTDSDLFILPEMFATGFCMEPAEVADREKETLYWMISAAEKYNTAICGSASVADQGNFVNRLYFVEPSGKYSFYDKRHLFTYSGENLKYHPGRERVIVNYKDWNILLQVCYDLRFPVFSRNNNDYDAIIYVANWPGSRIDAWKTLLKARAIENQAYVAGINRIGTDGNNLEYPESSYIFFPDGSEISTKTGSQISAVWDRHSLDAFRAKFPFLSDRDEFSIK